MGGCCEGCMYACGSWPNDPNKRCCVHRVVPSEAVSVTSFDDLLFALGWVELDHDVRHLRQDVTLRQVLEWGDTAALKWRERVKELEPTACVVAAMMPPDGGPGVMIWRSDGHTDRGTWRELRARLRELAGTQRIPMLMNRVGTHVYEKGECKRCKEICPECDGTRHSAADSEYDPEVDDVPPCANCMKGVNP